MKHIILTLLGLCISSFTLMFGQIKNVKSINSMEAKADDFISLLNKNGYEVFPFDISSLSDGKYNIAFKIKEYKDGVEVCDDILGGFYNFDNMTLTSDFPEEYQNEIKPEDMVDPERGIFTLCKKIIIGFSPAVNDSIRPVML